VLPRENLHDFAALERDLRESFGERLRLDEGVGAVSAIGAGINASFVNVGEALASLAGIPVLGLSTSSFRISLLLAEDQLEDAVRRLHARLVLGAPARTAD
jgi:aspartate kinase